MFCVANHLSSLSSSASLWCSLYQVVVEEERPRRARRAAEILRCYPVPIHFQNASLLSSQYYFTAEFPASLIQTSKTFTIGDNKTYNGYWNVPLLPHKSYSIYYQAVSTANGVSSCSHSGDNHLILYQHLPHYQGIEEMLWHLNQLYHSYSHDWSFIKKMHQLSMCKTFPLHSNP